MKPGDRFSLRASTGAVGFVRLDDLREGIMVLGMAMNPLVPDEPYEVVDIARQDNAARIRYVGNPEVAETQIASGPWKGGYGVSGECWIDASDLQAYGDPR